jgi:hypothetical protein
VFYSWSASSLIPGEEVPENMLTEGCCLNWSAYSLIPGHDVPENMTTEGCCLRSVSPSRLMYWCDEMDCGQSRFWFLFRWIIYLFAPIYFIFLFFNSVSRGGWLKERGPVAYELQSVPILIFVWLDNWSIRSYLFYLVLQFGQSGRLAKRGGTCRVWILECSGTNVHPPNCLFRVLMAVLTH